MVFKIHGVRNEGPGEQRTVLFEGDDFADGSPEHTQGVEDAATFNGLWPRLVNTFGLKAALGALTSVLGAEVKLRAGIYPE